MRWSRQRRNEEVSPAVGYNPVLMPVRWDAHRSALSSIVEAVGRTPLVQLNRVVGDARPPVYLKLEWYGPSGSLKRSEEHTSELQSRPHLVCRLLLAKEKTE